VKLEQNMKVCIIFILLTLFDSFIFIFLTNYLFLPSHSNNFLQDKHKSLGLIRKAYLMPYLDKIETLFASPLSPQIELNEGEFEKLKHFTFSHPHLKSEKIRLLLTQLDERFTSMYTNMTNDHTKIASGDFLPLGDDILNLVSSHLTEKIGSYVLELGQFSTVICEFILKIGELTADISFLNDYQKALDCEGKEKYQRDHMDKGDEDDEDDEDEDEDEEDVIRKHVLESGMTMGSTLHNTVQFQFQRLVYLTRMYGRCIEQILLQSKSKFQSQSGENIGSNLEKTNDVLTSLSRSVMCHFAAECENCRSEMSDAILLLKPFVSHLLLCLVLHT
jgi:hypothetical protein